MKKLILLLAFLVTTSIKSQGSASLTIIKIDPDTLDIGDTLSIYFNFTVTALTDTSDFNYFKVVGTNATWAYGCSYKDFYDMETVTVNGDSCRVLKVLFAPFFPLGDYIFSPGNFKLHFGGHKLATGIPEISPATLDPEYYDLDGHRIEKRTNQVIIEQLGPRRHKIIIQDR